MSARGPGTFSLAFLGGAIGTLHSGGNSWSNAGQGAIGSVTITTLTADRVTGTITATLPPTATNVTQRPLVTEGRFDLNFVP